MRPQTVEPRGRTEKAASQSTPKKGERFRCEQCGMELQITTDCACEGTGHSQFRCCNQEMAKV